MAAGKKKQGGKAAPQARRKPLALRKAAVPAKSGEADLKQQLADARTQQAATAAILRVIARSPSDAQPVFNAIVKNARRLIGGFSCVAARVVGDDLHLAAFTSLDKSRDQALRSLFPAPIARNPINAEVVRTGIAQFISDLRSDPRAASGWRKAASARGYRGVLVVPMLREDTVIGLIYVTRVEPGLFSGHHVELLKTFADQAVIAIENARSFNETKEALERQTATAEILKVIASSPSDVQPVFDAIAGSSMRLVGSSSAAVIRLAGESLHLAAITSTSREGDEALRRLFPAPLSTSVASRNAMETGKAQINEDMETDPTVSPEHRAMARLRGFRSRLIVPMMRDQGAVGAISVVRPQPGAFSLHQVSLLQTFADQAVIAIENVRLFNETKEALERQTATAEILKVIASSPSDVQPVFDAIVRSCSTLFMDSSVTMRLARNGQLHMVAHIGGGEGGPVPISRDSAVAACFIDRRTIYVPDAESAVKRFPRIRHLALKFGFRSAVNTPLLRNGVSIGTIAVRRPEKGAFGEKDLALLETFADQAVIAIENVRLFNETKEALERQTATAEVLKVIASSPTDVQPVFDAILRSAVNLCDAEIAAVFPYDGKLVHLGATHNWTDEAKKYFSTVYPSPPSPALLSGRTILGKSIVKLADAAADGHYDPKSAATGHWRRMLGVPMLREGQPLGALVVCWREPGDTPQRQVDLLQTFADQAVIAIENVRLFNETKESLERQTATADILKVIASSPVDVQPVFDAIVHSASRLFGRAATLRLVEADGLRRKALSDPAALQSQPPELLLIDSDSLGARVVRGGKALQVVDTRAPDAPQFARAHAHKWSFRSNASAPLVRDGVVIGTVGVSSPEPGALSDKQMELLATFADQAVIAIENVRLFNETKESLERQTATAEILRVIASSPSDVQPVFDAIVETAKRLIGAFSATVTYVDTGMLHLVAHTATTPEGAAALNKYFPIPVEGSPMGRAILLRRPESVDDFEADTDDARNGRELARSRGFRSVMFVPLMRGGVAIGSLNVTRREAGRMSGHQIDLLKTFADQAVIAIENVRLFNETKESLERQTATAEILKVISGSPTDVQPVLDAIVQSAARLFVPWNAAIVMREGNFLHLRATAGPRVLSREEQEAAQNRWPLPFDPEKVMTARVIADLQTRQILDTEAPDVLPGVKATARAGKYRSIAWVPLVRDGEGIGSIVLNHAQPGYAISEKQLALVRTFADQAVIAIENVRLFNETKEALDRQTATSGILEVMSGSPTDVQPVFDAIVKNGARLFSGAGFAIALPDSGQVRLASVADEDPERCARWKASYPFPLTRDYMHATAILDHRAIDVPDALNPPAEWSAGIQNFVRTGYRAITITPMMRGDTAIGTVSVVRVAPGPLTDKQIAILKTFADQAVIAIENVRLFNETKEALEQQTATAAILKVISESPTDTKPVFDAIVQSGLNLFPNAAVAVVLPEGNRMRMAAVATRLPAQAEAWRAGFQDPLSRDRMHGISILDGRLVDVPDAETEKDGPMGPGVKNFLAGGNRAITIMPMLCDDTAIGAISVIRAAPGPLNEKQLALLRTFAAQAVIAIENVRIFKELEARTGALTRSVEQLTALGEVGRTISSTLDLETVLKTIVQRAVQLTGLDGGSIYEYDEKTEEFQLRAAENLSDEIVEVLRTTPMRKGEGVIGHAVETGEPTEVPDMLDDSYQSPRRDTLIQAGYRALLVVPLRRDEHIIGALAVNRKTPGYFPHDVIELLKTFATQSAMAIQNARLFREIADKGKQLEVASRHKSDFLASMSHELRTPLNAILGFNEMILGEVYGGVPQDMKEPLEDIQKSGKHLLRLINNVLDLAKIEAGRMELSLMDYSVQDTVESVRSTLRPLAAEKGLEFLASVPTNLPLAYGDGGRITQCLMNLAGNSLKFTKAGKVEISVAEKDGRLTYCVTDTGIGIPADKIGSLFTEFKQTDATIASEYGGTGLGLSISKKFVEMHGGRIWVESRLGKGSAFIFEIPLRMKTP